MSSVWSNAFRSHGRRIRRALKRRTHRPQQLTISALAHTDVLDDVTTVGAALATAALAARTSLVVALWNRTEPSRPVRGSTAALRRRPATRRRR